MLGQSKGCHTGAVSHVGTVKGLSYRCCLTCWDSQRAVIQVPSHMLGQSKAVIQVLSHMLGQSRAFIQVLSQMLGQSKGCHTGVVSHAGTVKGLSYRCCLTCWDSQRAVIQVLSNMLGQSKGCHTDAVSQWGTVKGLSYRCCLKFWDSQRAVTKVLSHTSSSQPVIYILSHIVIHCQGAVTQQGIVSYGSVKVWSENSVTR